MSADQFSNHNNNNDIVRGNLSSCKNLINYRTTVISFIGLMTF